MKYRNQIPEPGTTISGFADSYKKEKKKKLMPTDRPQIFLTCDSKHTYIFFWPKLKQLKGSLGDKSINVSAAN